jgi:hypothetical protein
VHSGHTASINDVSVLKVNSFNEENYNLKVASVSNNNIIQIWSPSLDLLT